MFPRSFSDSTQWNSQVELQTEFGDFFAVHLQSDSKEGLVLRPKAPSGNTDRRLRIQSSCLFSESLRTTDCDCAAQLHESMVRIAKSGGALVYLYEEGRGAGLQAKMRAINLQQSLGLSSSEAYARLGLRADVRLDYAFVSSALEEIFGKEEWILLTNNPHKEALVREAGITIIGTESLVCDRGSSTVRAYLEAKRQQFGHRIEE